MRADRELQSPLNRTSDRTAVALCCVGMQIGLSWAEGGEQMKRMFLATVAVASVVVACSSAER